MITQRNEQMETMIELIEGMMHEEGYKTLRFSESKKNRTTAYDCLILRDGEGKEFKISFDECWDYIESKNKWERTNYISD